MERREFLNACLETNNDLDVLDSIIHDIEKSSDYRASVKRITDRVTQNKNYMTRATDKFGYISNFYVLNLFGWTGYFYVDDSKKLFVAALAIHESETPPVSLRMTLQSILHKAGLP